jgi:cellulose biosynthesis protein BcsQ
MSGRYVLLGLAHPRSAWFRDLAQWCNGGSLPAEFIKCLSPEEIYARLDSGRAVSAVVVDAGLSGIDRDLVSAVAGAGAATFVVDDSRIARDWLAVGAQAVFPPLVERAALLDALVTHAPLVDRVTEQPDTSGERAAPLLGGEVIAVCGSGGTGTSTAAIAIAQGCAATGRSVVLCDLRLQAEQGMLHDVTDTGRGLQALVEAHRSGALDPTQVATLTWSVPQRGYDLLTGLRRARFWSTVRPVAFVAAFQSLRTAYDVVVCDVDPDVEREETGGSLDVEERTMMSRTALREASVVLAVGHPSVKGLHSLNRVLVDLADIGVDPGRTIPVFNQSPKAVSNRAAFNAALAELVAWRNGDQPLLTPVHIPYRDIDTCIRSGDPLPTSVVDPLLSALTILRDANRSSARRRVSLVQRIRAGSLGVSTSEGLAS